MSQFVSLHRAVVAVAALCASVAARAEVSTTKPPAGGLTKPAVNELVVRYLACWNEHDGKKRRELIARTWTETGNYVDAVRHGEGVDGIDAMIKTAQDHYPGYLLHLVSGTETHDGYVRFSWAAGGAPDAPLYLAGTDFVAIAGDGRIQQVVGFVDAAPAH
jgi:hypothetical protein